MNESSKVGKARTGTGKTYKGGKTMQILNGFTAKTPQNFQLDAGVWLRGVSFSGVTDKSTLRSAITTAMGAPDNKLGATSGGGTFEIVPDLRDLMEDVDGAKGKYKDGMLVNRVDCKMTTTLVEATGKNFAFAIGCADSEVFDTTGSKVTIRYDLKTSDYQDLVWAGSINKEDGLMVVHFKNAMNTNGLSFTMENQGKGKYSIEVEPFIDLAHPEQSPVDIYII